MILTSYDSEVGPKNRVMLRGSEVSNSGPTIANEFYYSFAWVVPLCDSHLMICIGIPSFKSYLELNNFPISFPVAGEM